MAKIFKQGDIVKCTGSIILVTGPGDKNIGYPCFAGVVLKVDPSDDFQDWEVGFYSDTWTTIAFKKMKLNLSTLIPDQTP